MNIDEINTAVSPVEESSHESEQTADVQAHDEEITALEEFMADDETDGEDAPESEEKAEDNSEQTHSNDTEEVPSGIRGRILKAEKKADKAGYDRGYAEAQKAWAAEKAEYDAKLAKLAEKEFEEEVVKLAREEHISQNLARRLLTAEKGYAPQNNTVSEKATPSKTEQAVLSEDRRQQLTAQAAQIKQKFGMNVLDFVTDDDADAIFKGNMDLWEVALRSSKQNETPVKRNAPPPVRGGNGSSARHGKYDFDTMTDAEFERFNNKIDRGGVYRPR